MTNHNLTPEQLKIPAPIRTKAFQRIPPTCDKVREILTEAHVTIMEQLEIPPHDDAIVDAAMSLAFMKIRNEVTQVFRTEQMTLLSNRMINDEKIFC